MDPSSRGNSPVASHLFSPTSQTNREGHRHNRQSAPRPEPPVAAIAHDNDHVRFDDCTPSRFDAPYPDPTAPGSPLHGHGVRHNIPSADAVRQLQQHPEVTSEGRSQSEPQRAIVYANPFSHAPQPAGFDPQILASMNWDQMTLPQKYARILGKRNNDFAQFLRELHGIPQLGSLTALPSFVPANGAPSILTGTGVGLHGSSGPVGCWAQSIANRYKVTHVPDVHPLSDPTIQTIIDQADANLHTLLQALNNTVGVNDSANSKEVKLVSNSTDINDEDKISTCQLILSGLIHRSVVGYCGYSHKNEAKEDDKKLNSQQRFDQVVNTMRVEKTVCRDVLFEESKIVLLVHQPIAILEMKIRNRGNNASRKKGQKKKDKNSDENPADQGSATAQSSSLAPVIPPNAVGLTPIVTAPAGATGGTPSGLGHSSPAALGAFQPPTSGGRILAHTSQMSSGIPGQQSLTSAPSPDQTHPEAAQPPTRGRRNLVQTPQMFSGISGQQANASRSSASSSDQGKHIEPLKRGSKRKHRDVLGDVTKLPVNKRRAGRKLTKGPSTSGVANKPDDVLSMDPTSTIGGTNKPLGVQGFDQLHSVPSAGPSAALLPPSFPQGRMNLRERGFADVPADSVRVTTQTLHVDEGASYLSISPPAYLAGQHLRSLPAEVRRAQSPQVGGGARTSPTPTFDREQLNLEPEDTFIGFPVHNVAQMPNLAQIPNLTQGLNFGAGSVSDTIFPSDNNSAISEAIQGHAQELNFGAGSVSNNIFPGDYNFASNNDFETNLEQGFLDSESQRLPNDQFGPPSLQLQQIHEQVTDDVARGMGNSIQNDAAVFQQEQERGDASTVPDRELNFADWFQMVDDEKQH